jgi:hypothetical protein
MIPVYYRGLKYTTKERLAPAIHVRREKIDEIIANLLADCVIFMHGHRVFLDEEATEVRLYRAEQQARTTRALKKAQKKRLQEKRLLLAPGYCTHWLGVYHG